MNAAVGVAEMLQFLGDRLAEGEGQLSAVPPVIFSENYREFELVRIENLWNADELNLPRLFIRTVGGDGDEFPAPEHVAIGLLGTLPKTQVGRSQLNKLTGRGPYSTVHTALRFLRLAAREFDAHPDYVQDWKPEERTL